MTREWLIGEIKRARSAVDEARKVERGAMAKWRGNPGDERCQDQWGIAVREVRFREGYLAALYRVSREALS